MPDLKFKPVTHDHTAFIEKAKTAARIQKSV